MGWKHYQTVDPTPKRKGEPHVGRGLFGAHLQFSKPIKSSEHFIFSSI